MRQGLRRLEVKFPGFRLVDRRNCGAAGTMHGSQTKNDPMQRCGWPQTAFDIDVDEKQMERCTGKFRQEKDPAIAIFWRPMPSREEPSRRVADDTGRSLRDGRAEWGTVSREDGHGPEPYEIPGGGHQVRLDGELAPGRAQRAVKKANLS